MKRLSITGLLIAFTLTSCGPSSPALSPTSLPAPASVTTPTTFHESLTSTPTKPPATETKPATATAETIEFHGLITELAKIPTITAAEEQARIQKAIETTSVPAPVRGNFSDEIFVSQFDYTKAEGEGVKIGSNPSESFLIRDTYRKIIHTDQWDLPITKVLIELHVTFKDGTEGNVILPVVIDFDSDPLGIGFDARTQKRLDKYSRDLQKSVIDFRFLTSLSQHKIANPVILELLSRITSNEEMQSNLDEAHRLANEGKFLTQEEINELLDAIIDF